MSARATTTLALLLVSALLGCGTTPATSAEGPSAAGVQLGEAIVHLRTGDLRGAEAALERARSLDADHPTIPHITARIDQEREGRSALDRLKAALERGHIDDAEAAFEAIPVNSQARSEAEGMAYNREIGRGRELEVMAKPTLGEVSTRALLGQRYQTSHRFPLETRGRLGTLVSILPSGDFIAGTCNQRHTCLRHEGWLGRMDPLMQPTDAPQFIADIPRHFALAVTETRTADFLACVRAGACDTSQVSRHSQISPLCNLGHPERGDHPINCVTHEGAKQFCDWAGGRLPTEIEWERAARGANARRFPWGNDLPEDCTVANFHNPELPCSVPPMTRPAYLQREGLSPYGLFNAAGNVAEWTISPWREGTYADPGDAWPPRANPVIRGGNFESAASGIRTTSRVQVPAEARSPSIGLRCAFPI